MAMATMKLSFLLLLTFVTSAIATRFVDRPIKQMMATYTVRMDNSEMPSSFNHQFQWYDSILTSITTSPDVLYKYDTVIDGFSVRLTEEEAESLAKQTSVLAVIPDQVYKLHTTRTPEFLGLTHGQHKSIVTKTDQLVIGLLDSGIWPEHKSFDDSGLGPVPLTWKGSCDEGDNFTASSCNRKLIGARYFFKGYEHYFGPPDEKSARDYLGHGTHTASTAAGSVVQNASMFGLAPGVARGMAPDARIAAYKVCWGDGGCITSDVLAGLEEAIKDGVNVLSISLGGSGTDYYDDLLAIGAYSAMSKGIFVACAAGNSGPETVTNVAPWITTVGASTLDREFPTNVTLGNGEIYTGVSLCNEAPFMESPVPLVYGEECETLDSKLIKGKVVVCDQDGPFPSASMSMDVKDAGGVGLILVNTQGEEVFPVAFFLPSAVMGKEAGNAIKSYIDSDPNATSVISPASTKLGVQPSPAIPFFSSRGPNYITPEILKPDLIAPGVTVIAAWSGASGPTSYDFDKRNISFNIISGTSMSCPHVGGLALLLKGAHPDWSPAFIRSALMTTAYTTSKDGEPIIDRTTEAAATPLDYGSGHVDPMAALDPGLVYDASEDDYLGFLCALNYTSSQIKTVTQQSFTCDPSQEYSLGDFNYPSFSVVLGTSSNTATYTRTLTNVGEPSTYDVVVSFENQFVNATVEPSTLTFSQVNEKNSYTVTFVSSLPRISGAIFGSLEWSDGIHKVRSPIVVDQK